MAWGTRFKDRFQSSFLKEGEVEGDRYPLECFWGGIQQRTPL